MDKIHPVLVFLFQYYVRVQDKKMEKGCLEMISVCHMYGNATLISLICD